MFSRAYLMMNPEFDLSDVPLEDHPRVISDALDELEADLAHVQVNPKAGN